LAAVKAKLAASPLGNSGFNRRRMKLIREALWVSAQRLLPIGGFLAIAVVTYKSHDFVLSEFKRQTFMTFPNSETCFKESPGIAIGELAYRQVRRYVTKALQTQLQMIKTPMESGRRS